MNNAGLNNSKTSKTADKVSIIIIWICLTILSGLVMNWFFSKSDGTILGRFGAIVNAALFAALGIRFVPLWVDAWSKTGKSADIDTFEENGINSHNEAGKNATLSNADLRSVSIRIFFIFLLIDLLIILLIYILQVMSGNREPFKDALNLWRATDSASYLTIAESWYAKTGEWDRLVQLVFLPGYPILIRIVNIFFVGNYLYSAMIISALAFAGAGTMMYRLLRLDYSHEEAVRALKFLCILPGAFFFASPMTESLYLFLSVSCFYCLRKKDWFSACALGGMASFTRSLGLVLFVPVLFEMISHDIKENPLNTNVGIKRIMKYANLLLILFGFGCYLLVNYQVSGNPFQFLIYQKEHWHQSLGLFFNTVSYQTDYAVRCLAEKNYHNFIGLWLPNLFCIFTGLGLMLAAVKKMRPSYTAYYMVYYVIAMGATWLLSAPRYHIALLPLPVALSVISRKRWVEEALTVAYTILYVLYSYAFVNRWNVW
ncbi:MAG TPA: hypothetical protein GX505_11885 [Clostridiales bacterium]|nr:hypothetical protein [Clostridiales bacterium]